VHLQDHAHIVLHNAHQDILTIFPVLENILILDTIILTVPQLQELALQVVVIIMDHVQFHPMIVIIDMVISIPILLNTHTQNITLIVILMPVLAHPVVVP